MKWLWEGPLRGGITQSMISRYLQDPFQFVLYYGLGLEVAHQTSKEILWGNGMHAGLEHMIRIPKLKEEFNTSDWALVDDAIKQEYLKDMNTPPGTAESIMEMIRLYNDKYKANRVFRTEIEFMKPHHTGCNEVTLMGKVDGLESHTLVEHKTKKRMNKVQLRAEIPYDVQTILYCKAMQCTEVIYDVFLVPDFQFALPARKHGEYYSSYWKRLYHNHDGSGFPIKRNIHTWTDQIRMDITQEMIDNLFTCTINPIIDSMCDLYEHCSKPGFDPFDPKCYSKILYRRPIRQFDPSATTDYKSDYWPFLVGQLDKDSLIPIPKLFKELTIGQ